VLSEPKAGEAAAAGEAPAAANLADRLSLPKPPVLKLWLQLGSSVGLDIGASYIKVAQVVRSKGRPAVLNLGLCSTPEGAVGELGVCRPGAVGAAIRSLFSSRGILDRRVLAALGGQRVVISHLDFPHLSVDELREVLRWEAEDHVPFPLDEAVVDYTVLPSPLGGESPERSLRVMLAAARRQVIDCHVSALEQARLSPMGIDVEPLARHRLVRVFPGWPTSSPGDGAEAIVDIGHSSTTVSVFFRGTLQVNRVIGTGGAAFTAAIAERLKMPPLEAELMKRQCGVRPESGRVFRALSPVLQVLLREVGRTLDFYASKLLSRPVRVVHLTGGGARMPGLAEALARHLAGGGSRSAREKGGEARGLGEAAGANGAPEVRVVEPLAAVPPLLKGLGLDHRLAGPEFSTAIGLALAGGGGVRGA